jgi:hypothetical protein
LWLSGERSGRWCKKEARGGRYSRVGKGDWEVRLEPSPGPADRSKHGETSIRGVRGVEEP